MNYKKHKNLMREVLLLYPDISSGRFARMLGALK